MQTATTFDLDAGVDCLAFVNTLEGRGGERTTELLTGYGDLLAFALQTGALDESKAQALISLADARPSAARDVLAQAISLRETLYRIFSAVAAGRDIAHTDLENLNHELSAALGNLRLHPEEDVIAWTWSPEPDLRRPLWPIARSAADVLASDEAGRVRECAAHDCGWLFLDESRNRSRRWCNMQTCGNRAKVDRFRARQRGAELIETEE